MSWEITLFYWVGWFATTSILAALGVVGSRVLWMIYNKSESAFRANAALANAYLYYAYKYRFRDVEPGDISRMTIDGYEFKVEKLD